MSITVPIPAMMGLIDWADQVVFAAESIAPIERLDIECDWQRWAASLCGVPGISGSAIPDPYEFSGWQDWASAFVQSIQ